ncbi:MAG: hypothetical protein R2856_33945 [Caldilineaceae bacterium]
MPHSIPAVALAVLWTYLLQPCFWADQHVPARSGHRQPAQLVDITRFGALLGDPDQRGLAVATPCWIFLAGLQGVPQELTKRRTSTAPVRGPSFATSPSASLTTIAFNLVLGVIGARKVFTTAWVATQRWTVLCHVVLCAAHLHRSLLLLVWGTAARWPGYFAMIFTYFQVRTSRRWVHYEGGIDHGATDNRSGIQPPLVLTAKCGAQARTL